MQTAIKETLEDLTEDDFKNLQWYLQQPDNLEGQRVISLAALEDADRRKTTDLVFRTYPNHAGQIMLNLLKKINRNDLMDRFTKVLEAQGATTSGPEVDFVTKHRSALIQRVTMVEAILDLLVDEGVMQSEDYGDVRAEKSSAKKMRELFVLLDKRGDKAKRVFYKALEKKEKYLLDDLKSQ